MTRLLTLTLTALLALGCEADPGPGPLGDSATAPPDTSSGGEVTSDAAVEGDTAGPDVTAQDAATPPRLACYVGEGACVPGEAECGTKKRCDYSAQTGFACGADALATGEVGEPCGDDAECGDGTICAGADAKHCRALCCGDTDCGQNETCTQGAGILKVCIPDGVDPMVCYESQGTCLPGDGTCGAGSACAFTDPGLACSSNPTAMATLGSACSDTTGPACVDGLHCSPDSNTCVTMCCMDAQCSGGDTCNQIAEGLWVCGDKAGPIVGPNPLLCYADMGACQPGEDQCGVNGGCDFSGTNFQCFNDPPATAGLSQACDLTSGPACKDGLTCSPMTNTCAPLCCTDYDCCNETGLICGPAAKQTCQQTGVGHALCVPMGETPADSC